MGTFNGFMGMVVIGPPVKVRDCRGDFVNDDATGISLPFGVLLGFVAIAEILARLGDFVLGDSMSYSGATKPVDAVILVVAVMLARLGFLATGDANVALADQESPDGRRLPILRTIVMQRNSFPSS